MGWLLALPRCNSYYMQLSIARAAQASLQTIYFHVLNTAYSICPMIGRAGDTL